MKTTDELYREAQQLLDEKKAKRAEENAEIEAQREAIKRAECAAQSAIESGDETAYAKAQQTITFATKRAEALKLKHEENKKRPVRDLEYYAQFRSQLEVAYHSELKPLYEDLVNRVKECGEIYQKILAVHTTVDRTKVLFNDALPCPANCKLTRYSFNGLNAFGGNALEDELNSMIRDCDKRIELFSK